MCKRAAIVAVGTCLIRHLPNTALTPYGRCKRAAMVVVDGVIKACNIAEAPDDPAGDDHPEVSRS